MSLGSAAIKIAAALGDSRYAWRGIIPGLPHSVKPSPEFCRNNSQVVLLAELHFYNTVVPECCCTPQKPVYPALFDALLLFFLGAFGFKFVLHPSSLSSALRLIRHGC
jgi:hypothetical protein